MKREKSETEYVLEDFFDLELPAFKGENPEKLFDLSVLKTFKDVDEFANALLFKKKIKNNINNSNPIGKNTIFFPPKHKKLSKIVSIVSPSEAKKSVEKIKKLVGKGYTKKQLRASLILAGVRAKLLAKKPNISSKEKQELKKVAEIYFKGAKQI